MPYSWQHSVRRGEWIGAADAGHDGVVSNVTCKLEAGATPDELFFVMYVGVNTPPTDRRINHDASRNSIVVAVVVPLGLGSERSFRRTG